MKKSIATKQQSLRDFTDEHYAQGSFAFSRLLRAGEIRVNGARVRRNVRLAPGDEVVWFTTAKEEARPFYAVVYEDENVLVADKYAGVNTEALAEALKERGARAVHRLDRNTCGLLVFARTDAAECALLEAFRARRVRKEYEALCFHPFSVPEAVCTAYLKKDSRAARVKVSPAPAAGYEKIVTEYAAEETPGEVVRVRIVLHSGKTHQIRAHMAFLGHPVVGDEKYGDEALNRQYGVKRHILVAKRLSFSLSGALAYLNGKTFESAFSAQLPAR